MKKQRLLTRLGVAVAMGIAVAVLASVVLGQGGDSGGTVKLAQGVPGSDSNPTGPVEIVIPERYRPQPGSRPIQAGTTILWFTPQDEDTSTTVIFLYNTSDLISTATIETFMLDGSPIVDTDVLVPAHGLVRICADAVSTVSATWQDAVWINFTTYSTYGRLTLPAGVRAEAYVVWNGGTSYDPLQIAPTLPIRFSVGSGGAYLPLAPNALNP
ncbi:MAG: hypothetical protein ACP5SI_06805 [Chloroflexia bacterium]